MSSLSPLELLFRGDNYPAIGGTAPNPFNGPALFAMPLSFLCCWYFSVTDKSARAEKERKAFDAQFVRSQTGIGISGASDH